MESILLLSVAISLPTTTCVRTNGKSKRFSFPNSRTDGGTLSIQTVSRTILVAEREPTARSSLSELLREEGYRVVEAADSSVAVAQLNGDPSISIILTDLEMPSWTSIIRLARSQLPESFILGMLRYGALTNAIEAQSLGAQAYLLKPLDFAEVNQWINRYLSGQSSIKT